MTLDNRMIQKGRSFLLLTILWLMSGQCIMSAHAEEQASKTEPFRVTDYMMSSLYRVPDKTSYALPHWWNGLSLSTYWNPKMLNAQVEYQGWETNSFGFGLTKDFSKSNALRVGYAYQTNRHEMTMDFQWNLSNLFGGYDPQRDWEWLTTIGVSGGLSRYLDDGSWRKFYGGQIGLQLRHTLSPYVSIYVEPQYKAVSPLYDSQWDLGNIVDDGLSLQVGLITRLSSPWKQGGYGHQAYEVLSWIYGVGNRLVVPEGLEKNHSNPRSWYAQLLGGVQIISPWHTLSGTRLHPYSVELNIGRHLNSIYDIQASLYRQDVEITSMEGSHDAFGIRVEGSADVLRAICPASYQHGWGWTLGGGIEFGRVHTSDPSASKDRNHLSPTLSSQLRKRLHGPLWLIAQGRMEMAPVGQDRMQMYAHAGLHYDMPHIEEVRALVPDWMHRLAKPSMVAKSDATDNTLWYAQLLGGVQIISPWHTLSGTRLLPYSLELNVGRRLNNIYGIQAGLYSQDVEITAMEGAHEAIGLRFEGISDLLRALWPVSRERGLAWTLGGGFEVGRVTTEGEISERSRMHLSPTISSQLQMRLYGPLWLIAQGRMEMAPIGQDRMQIYAHAGLHYDVPRIEDIHVPAWMHRMSKPSIVSVHEESRRASWYAQLLGGVQVISPWHTLSSTRLQPYSFELNVGRHLNSIYGIQAGLYHQDVEITSMEGSHKAFGLRVEGTADFLRALWPNSEERGWGWTLGGGVEVGRVNTTGETSARNRTHVSPTLSSQLRKRLYGPLWLIAQGRMEMAPIGQDRMQMYAHAGLHYEIPPLQDLHVSLPKRKHTSMPEWKPNPWYVQLLAGAQVVSPWHTLSSTRLNPYSLELNLGRQFNSIYGIQAGLYRQDVEITALDGSYESFGLRLEGTADLLHAIWPSARGKGWDWNLGGGMELGRVNTIEGASTKDHNHLSPTISSQLRMRLTGPLWLVAQGRMEMAPVGQDRLQAYAHIGLHYDILHDQNGQVNMPAWMRRLAMPTTNEKDSASWYVQLLGGVQVISPWHTLSGTRFLPYSFELNAGRRFNSIYGIQAGLYRQDVEITALEGSHEAFGLRLEGTADLLHAIWPSTSAHGLGWTVGGGMEFGKVNTTEGVAVRNHNHLSPTISSQLRVRLKGPLWLIAQGRIEMAPIGQDLLQTYAHAGIHYDIPRLSTSRLVVPAWMQRLAAPAKAESKEGQEQATWYVQLLGGAQVISPWHNLSSTRLHPYSLELNIGKQLNRIYGVQAGLYRQDVEITSLEGSHEALGLRLEGNADVLAALWPASRSHGLGWTLGGGLELGRVKTTGDENNIHLSPVFSSQLRMKLYGPLWFIAQGHLEMAPIGQDRIQAFGHIGLHYQFCSKKN